MPKAKSPLRYPGGKSRAIKSIMKHVPVDFQEYREPFLGGGSVYFAIKEAFGSRIKSYWVNDIYTDLFHFWSFARDDIKNLVESVTTMRDAYPNGRELYTELKKEEVYLSGFELAARFFIMNRITFSGVMDAGGYSQQAFERRFTISSIERLQNINYWLQETKITNEDYALLLESEGDDVFIFLDPPYLSKTHSRLYGKKGKLHTSFDHQRLADALKKCPHRWLLTYDDSEEVRELFQFANIIEWELQYGMNNYKQKTAAKGKELFIKNY
ncbi:MAG: DNA adenine methylase [Anaerolineae bacterium]|nr:DNA adenine methylase [Anaerolineae bacterium]MDQ7034086.1 DNA adenine methylase [Anaerolineae bacterium]